jgi:formylglycine-generating enzyme required for sulfatase activity
VEIDAFWIGQTVVTQAEFQLFMDGRAKMAERDPPPPKIPTDKLADAVTYPSPVYTHWMAPELQRMGEGGNFPAVFMSQYAARQYTKWLSKKTGRFYRLPTEAEWEYAARAGTTSAYSFGDDPAKLLDYAIFLDNSPRDGDEAYRAVGSNQPNAWGLYDMHGNVAQWCIDAYDPEWYQRFAGKPAVNWRDAINWPKEEHPRVLRGGCYQSQASRCRSAARLRSTPDFNRSDPELPQSIFWLREAPWIGFRVVSPVKEPPEAEKQRFWDDESDYVKRWFKINAHRVVQEIPAK